MSTIKTGTTTTTGLIVEADTSGNLVVQTGSTPTTALTISGTNQQITPAAPISMVGGYSFRNKIINGNFDIWQRGTSQTSSGYGSVDRWRSLNVGTTKTASQQAFVLGQTDVPNNPKYFMRHVVSSVAGASNYASMDQKIEGVETLSGKTVTATFWAKADASKNIAVEFLQYFGSGGSPSTFVIADAQLVALTTSWTKYTITVALPSVSGKTVGSNGDDDVRITFWFDAGSTYDSRAASLGQQSGTFDIAQVQLEEGTAATSFEMRPIGMELSLCRRYYELVSFQHNATNAGLANSYAAKVNFLPKRSVPTITYYSSYSGAGTSGSLTWYPGATVAAATSNGTYLDGVIPYRSGTSTSNFVVGSVRADAEL